MSETIAELNHWTMEPSPINSDAGRHRRRGGRLHCRRYSTPKFRRRAARMPTKAAFPNRWAPPRRFQAPPARLAAKVAPN